MRLSRLAPFRPAAVAPGFVWRRRAAALALVGLGVAALLGGCTTTGSDVSAGFGVSSRRPARLAWIDAPPEGCRVASAGPTLDPQDALRIVRDAAIEALAQSEMVADVGSISGTGAHGDFELSTQALSGSARNARLVAFWAETPHPSSATPRILRLHGLACAPGVTLPARPSAAPVTGWLAEAHASDRVCALGLAGPTRRMTDQPARALEDARFALALTIESHVEKRVHVRSSGVARVARRVAPSARARASAAAVETLERSWADPNGVGPLGLPGVLYGLACVDTS